MKNELSCYQVHCCLQPFHSQDCKLAKLAATMGKDKKEKKKREERAAAERAAPTQMASSGLVPGQSLVPGQLMVTNENMQLVPYLPQAASLQQLGCVQLFVAWIQSLINGCVECHVIALFLGSNGLADSGGKYRNGDIKMGK